MRYNELYAQRAQRAVEVALVDVGAKIEELEADGVPPERINAILIDDLDNDGQIFGRFFRSLVSAGEVAISLADSQAAITGFAAGGDPAKLEAIEQGLSDQEVTWVCTAGFHSESHQCLALHGVTKTRGEFARLGLRPRVIHSRCLCDLIPSELAKDIKLPVLRNMKPGQTKGGRLTVRDDNDERAIQLREKALDSDAGRAILEAFNHGE